jgi:hypothetical protein
LGQDSPITAWGWNPQPRPNRQGLLANSLDDFTIIFSGVSWIFNYYDGSAEINHIGDKIGVLGFVIMIVIPEPQTALLSVLRVLLVLRRRR